MRSVGTPKHNFSSLSHLRISLFTYYFVYSFFKRARHALHSLIYIHSCTYSGFDDDFDEADMQLGASGGSAAAAAKP